MLTLFEAYVKLKEKYPDSDFYDYADDLGDIFVFSIKPKPNKEKIIFNKGKNAFLKSLLRATSPSWGIPWIKVNKSTGEVSFYKGASVSERKDTRVSLNEVIKTYNNSQK